MRKPFALALAATAVAGTTALSPALIPALASSATAAPTGSAYAAAVLKDDPSAFLQGLDDVTGNTGDGKVVGGSTATKLPNGDPALAFNGNGQYAQFTDSKAFEVDSTGVLTAEFWMRPDTLDFTDTEGSGYVYTMGKGTGNAHEWYTRMYTRNNAENRPNRISGYVFNPAGGLGSGSYFQDSVKTGEWIHVALVINANAKSSAYPMGYVKIYKNGALRDTDSLKDYNITPKSGSAPLRVGTGYLNSFFDGAMGDIAFYDHELSAAQIKEHTAAMSKSAPAAPATPSAPSTPATPSAPSTPDNPGAPATPTTPPPADPGDPVVPEVPIIPTLPVEDTHSLDGIDVRRATDQLVEYTGDRGSSTGTNEWGIEATVVNGTITAISNGAGDTDIPAGGYVLSGHGTARAWLLVHARVGSHVSIVDGEVTITPPSAD